MSDFENVNSADEEESGSLFDLLENRIADDPIPEVFYSFDTGEPFAECSLCGKPLAGTENDYLVEKAVKNYPGGTTDIIFEYACCADCYRKIHGKISKESQVAMLKAADKYAGRLAVNLGLPGPPEPEKCCYSDKPLSECSEYQFFGIFSGNKKYSIINTCAISDDIIEEIQESLSEKTREELDDFTKQISPDFPVGEEIIKFRPILI